MIVYLIRSAYQDSISISQRYDILFKSHWRLCENISLMKILSYKKLILSIFCIIGRQYDKEGNMKQWWKNETINAFRTRAQCIVDQYSGYKLEQIGLNVGIYCMYYKLCKKHQHIASEKCFKTKIILPQV